MTIRGVECVLFTWMGDQVDDLRIISSIGSCYCVNVSQRITCGLPVGPPRAPPIMGEVGDQKTFDHLSPLINGPQVNSFRGPCFLDQRGPTSHAVQSTCT